MKVYTNAYYNYGRHGPMHDWLAMMLEFASV